MKFNPNRVSHYLVTGYDRNGKRFRIVTPSYIHMKGINVWNGSKWEVDVNGKRKLLWRIRN